MAINLGDNNSTSGEFTGNPGEVVEVIEVEKDSDHIPGQAKLVGDGLKTTDLQAVETEASRVVQSIVSTDVNSPEFQKNLNVLTTVAQNEMRAMGEGSSRLLDRSMKDMSNQKGTPQERVAGTLLDLQGTITDINGGETNPFKKALALLPGGKKVNGIMQRYQTAQETLNNITDQLLSGKDLLLEDNAALQTEQEHLKSSAYNLFEYVKFTDEVKEKLEKEIKALRASSDPADQEKADIYETQLMFPIQQRRQDLRTQIAVAVQAYETMELIKENNKQLALGVDRAHATTLVALRTAVMVSSAQSAQKMVSDSLAAANSATEELMRKNAKDLKANTLAIQENAVKSAVSPEVLKETLQAVADTTKSIQEFRSRANGVIEQSIVNLDKSISQATSNVKALDSAESKQFSIEK